MKIDKGELHSKISKLKGFVPTNSPMEALKGILYKNGYLIAASEEMVVKAKLEVLEGEDEEFIIPLKAFDFIGSLPLGVLEIKCKEETISFSVGKLKSNYKTHTAVNFAYERESIASDGITPIEVKRLKAAVDHVTYAAATNNANRTMMGVHIYSDAGKLNFICLDGHRVAWDSVEYAGNVDMIISKQSIEKIMKLNLEGDVLIAHDVNGVMFRTDDYEIYTRLIQGAYFDISKMFMQGELFTVINRKQFEEAMTRVKLCGDVNNKAPVAFSMKNSQIDIAFRSEFNDYSESIEVQEPWGKELKIGFSPWLLLECIKSFDSDELLLEMTGEKMPMIIKAGDSDMKALVLPVATRG